MPAVIRAKAELSRRATSSDSAMSQQQRHQQHHQLKPELRGLCLVHLLYSCARAVSTGDIEQTSLLLEKLSSLASLTGDPMQRLSTYFMEALAARMTMAWPGLYRALHSTLLASMSAVELQAARQVLFTVCPYLKFGFLTANQTILDAMQGEKVVHVIDISGSLGCVAVQWQALLQAFNSRSEGPPHLRITIVNENRDVLTLMGQMLTETADRLDIPFQFHPVAVGPQQLERDLLGVKSGEAVAVSSLLQLHRLLACEAQPTNTKIAADAAAQRPAKRLRQVFENPHLSVLENGHQTVEECAADRILRLLHSLNPKVVVVVEQDSDHNASQLTERFSKALHYYSAVFDSLDSTLPETSSERIALEKLFGQEIRNIVACEGSQRLDRHESLDEWRRRFEKAKFKAVGLSPTTIVQAERLLCLYAPDRYKLQRDKGALTLCWEKTPILSVFAWGTCSA